MGPASWTGCSRRGSYSCAHAGSRPAIRAAALPEVRDELDQASRRVSSIAAVHRQLYSGGSLGRIVAGEYLGSLLRDMAASSPERAIRLDAPPDLAWSADRATTCGLVMTELVINALKYGRGTVAVRVEPGANEADSIAVEDEGPGPPAGFDPASSTGLGMRILRALLRGGGLELVDGVGERSAERIEESLRAKGFL